ncbi:hypothetical protein D0T49_03605 [Paludibacter sp. 221]|uniref:PcfJ domain-containing protein n=1 Tax=Paludibacter sp. 221 TaxID=2302939 RepID=UPI0013D032E3|nr:PcfJ domain-containing protein [Paludibacter sp. 221]NDV46126.1 hypothetical protein [Paludibacter sp. 221]
MKPRTRLQREIVESAQYLFNRENEILPWASKVCLEHRGYATKKRVVCMDCGETFSPEMVKRKQAVCPHCNTRIKVTQSRKTTDEQRTYVAYAEIYGEFQVIRNYELRSYHRAGEKARYYFDEILQHWILPNGKREVYGKNHTTNWYCDSWNGDMEIRRDYPRYYGGDKYDVYPYKYHPASVFKPMYSIYGINHKLEGFTFLEAIKVLPHDPKAETLLKAKQYSMLGQWYSKRGSIDKYWASIKICLRNKYMVKDAGLWLDYLDLLSYFKKDLHNAKYVCPKNLRKEHDRFVAKKRKIQERKNMEGDYLSLLEYFGIPFDKKNYVFPKNLKQEYNRLLNDKKRVELEKKLKWQSDREKVYREFIERFIDLVISDGELVIEPLKTIEEFKQEGDELKHCVFTNEYFKKDNKLILSAKLKETRVETIEFNLKTMKVDQCRGKHNNNTEYHDRILKLLNRNKKLIAERVTA